MKKLVFLLIAFLVIELASASFEAGKPPMDISKEYTRNAEIEGWINISLDEEPSNSILRTNMGDSINLLDFLKQESSDYSCSPSDCEPSYTGSNAELTKTNNLDANEEIIYAIKISGNVDEFDNIRFKLLGYNAKSCTSPIKIDFGNNGDIDWVFNVSSDEFNCFPSYGCYEDSLAEADKELSYDEDEGEIKPYCEKITLNEGSKFKLNAWVMNGSTQNVELKMQLYNLDGEKIDDAGCTLPEEIDTTTNGGVIGCPVDFTTMQEDYYLCIYSNKETDWKIKSETHNPCGSYGLPSKNNIDIYVYAENAKFMPINEFQLNDDDIQNKNYESFSEIIDSYLENKFDKDCSSDCYVPIRFISGISQNLIIDDIYYSYDTSSGHPSYDKLFDVTEQTPLISLDFEKLDLDSTNFTTKGAYGTREFTIYINNDIIDSESIEIVETAEISGISPTTVAAGVSTKFVLEVSNESEIEKYEWDFDDDVEETTTKNQVYHVYTEVDEYDLEVTLTDKDDTEIKKSFTISVISPETLIPQILQKNRNNLKDLRNSSSLLPSFVKTYIDDIIDLDDLNETLEALQEEYEDASSTDDYIEVMLGINNLSIPEDILVTDSGNPIFIPEEDTIDLEDLKRAGAGSYNDDYKDDYKEQIIAYILEETVSDYSYKVYSFIYPEKNEEIVSWFKLTIDPSDDLYLVLNQNPILKQDYDEEEYGDFLAIELEEKKTIEFLYPGKVSLEDLAYASPKFVNLNTGEIEPVSDTKPYGWILLALIILFVLAFLAYLLLQQWYRKNYEKSLFTNENDLFNLINFIKTAESKQIKIKEIYNRLKKLGWSSEQITYAWKKLHGKRTGMFEIPIFDIFNKKKARSRLQENLNKQDPRLIQ